MKNLEKLDDYKLENDELHKITGGKTRPGGPTATGGGSYELTDYPSVG